MSLRDTHYLGIPENPRHFLFGWPRGVGQTLATEPRPKVWFSKGKLFFQSPEGLKVNLKLHDLRGSLVLEESFGVPKGILPRPLNLPSRGVYLALIETGEQRRVVKCWE